MPPKIGDIIEFSIQKTKAILFPFRFKRWLKILFIVWLAGHLGGGGGGGNLGNSIPRNPPTSETQETIAGDTTAVDATGTPRDSSVAPEASPQIPQPPLPEGSADGQKAPVIKPEQIPMFVGFGIALILMGLLLLWLSSRFNFIFIDLLKDEDVKIRESFRAHRENGNAFFWWNIWFMIAIFVGFAVLILLGILAIKLIWLLPLIILIGFLALFALILFSTIVIDFALPMMYQDKIKTRDAISKFFSAKPGLGSLALYFLLKMAFGIAAGFLSFIALAIVIIVALIPIGIIALIGFLIASALPAMKAIFLVLGVILLVPAILSLLILIGMVLLPIPIFFRVFTLTYLYKLNPEYNLLGFGSPSAS